MRENAARISNIQLGHEWDALRGRVRLFIYADMNNSPAGPSASERGDITATLVTWSPGLQELVPPTWGGWIAPDPWDTSPNESVATRAADP